MWTYLSGRGRYMCRICQSLVEWSSTPGIGKCKCSVFESYSRPQSNPPRDLNGTFSRIKSEGESENGKREGNLLFK